MTDASAEGMKKGRSGLRPGGTEKFAPEEWPSRCGRDLRD